MSSHYFVKEGQEPALFILEPLAHSLVSPLLEWAPYVLVAENALENVLSWGTRIDAVVTKNSNSIELTSLREQQVFELFSCDDSQDLLYTGVKILKGRSQSAVTVTIQEGDAPFPLVTPILSQLNIAFISNAFRWLPVTHTFEKWLPKNSVYKVRKVADNQHLMLNGFRLEGDFIISNNEGIVSVSSDKVVWLGESL